MGRPVTEQVALGALVAALSGCGSSAPKPSAPDSVLEACLQLQDAVAARWARCDGGTHADWQAYVESFQDCAATPDHLLAGRVAYHAERFPTCIATLQQPCDREAPGYCPFEVIAGVVPDGQPCQDTQVCGLYSDCFNVGTEACGEICVGFGNENQTCGLYCGGTSPCLDGPFCDPDLACVNNVCVRTKAAGATCGLGDPVPCAAELHCTAHPVDAQSVGTCEPRVTGGACFANTDCPGSDFCWQGVCTARRSQGQACSDAPTGCAPWTWCDRPTGTCVPGGRPGLPCLLTADARYVYCQVGACSPESVCVPYANPGESCDWNACAMGGSCDVATLTCVACAP